MTGIIFRQKKSFINYFCFYKNQLFRVFKDLDVVLLIKSPFLWSHWLLDKSKNYVILFFSPIPRLQWFRNGQIIQSDNSRYGINPYLPTKLTVRQVDETVTGQYKCVATNKAGSDFTVGTLHIASRFLIRRIFVLPWNRLQIWSDQILKPAWLML